MPQLRTFLWYFLSKLFVPHSNPHSTLVMHSYFSNMWDDGNTQKIRINVLIYLLMFVTEGVLTLKLLIKDEIEVLRFETLTTNVFYSFIKLLHFVRLFQFPYLMHTNICTWEQSAAYLRLAAVRVSLFGKCGLVHPRDNLILLHKSMT